MFVPGKLLESLFVLLLLTLHFLSMCFVLLHHPLMLPLHGLPAADGIDDRIVVLVVMLAGRDDWCDGDGFGLLFWQSGEARDVLLLLWLLFW